MDDTIRRFPEQFDWDPVVEHHEMLGAYRHFIVCGVGGSQLGSSLIRSYGLPAQAGPRSTMIIHRDYGLPDLPEGTLHDALVILSSYSGTTEETLDAGTKALARGLSIAAITTGGKLLAFARQHGLPHIVMPDRGLEPRLATGLSMLSLARLMGDRPLEESIRTAGKKAEPAADEIEGARLAGILHGKVPLMYTSARNAALGYVWKIKLNETGKIPAFCNVVPEMCHNELCGMDVVAATRPLSANMHALFLEDEDDHPRNRLRMRVAGEILEERGIPVEKVQLEGYGFEKAFRSSLLADWVSLSLARHYGVPDAATPLIADFKRRIAT